MKKTVALMLTILMLAAVLSVFAVPTSAAAASTFEAKKADVAPTIDGVLDEAYKQSTLVMINKGPTASAAVGNTYGKAYVLWDFDYMYVFFEVFDPILSVSNAVESSGIIYWKRDSVEFFCDLSGKMEGSMLSSINAGQWQAAAPFEGAPTEWGIGRGRHQYDENKANSELKGILTTTGYNVEMKIPWGADYTAVAGNEIGVVFHINSDEILDGEPGANTDGREFEYFAGYGQAAAWQDTKNWDKLKLVSDNPADYVPPEDTGEAGDEPAITLPWGDGGSDDEEEESTTEAPKSETETADTETEAPDEGGCGSFIGGTVGVVCIVGAAAAIISKKKKDE